MWLQCCASALLAAPADRAAASKATGAQQGFEEVPPAEVHIDLRQAQDVAPVLLGGGRSPVSEAKSGARRGFGGIDGSPVSDASPMVRKIATRGFGGIDGSPVSDASPMVRKIVTRSGGVDGSPVSDASPMVRKIATRRTGGLTEEALATHVDSTSSTKRPAACTASSMLSGGSPLSSGGGAERSPEAAPARAAMASPKPLPKLPKGAEIDPIDDYRNRSLSSPVGHIRESVRSGPKLTTFGELVEEFEIDGEEAARLQRVMSENSFALVRSFSRNVARRMSRRHSTLRTASRHVPAPLVSASAKPLYSGVLQGVTVNDVREAILGSEKCPLLRFLHEVVECTQISATDWKYCTEMPGTQIRKVLWSAPLPPDMSDTIARLLSLPPALSGTTVWRLQERAGVLSLIQHSYTREVMYGDRFRLQNILQFSPDPSGSGVKLDSFAETIWVSPLPWTHHCVKMFIERKSRAEAVGAASQLRRIIEETMAERSA